MQEISLGTFAPNKEPFEIAFIYADSGNFVVKGMQSQVSDFITREYKYYFANRTTWKNGQSNKCWCACRDLYLIPIKKNNRRTWKVLFPNGDEFSFRRLPKKWLPEWTTILDEYAIKKQVEQKSKKKFSKNRYYYKGYARDYWSGWDQ